MRRNLTILLISLIITTSVTAQTTHTSVCYVHQVSSNNQEYYLITTPFDNIKETSFGKTEVFKTDLGKMYEIPRYFEIWDNRNELYISNDGKTIAYVIDREFKWENVDNKAIEIFKNGIKFNEYALSDLIQCNNDTEDCSLLYKDAIDSVKWRNGRRSIIYKSGASDFERRLTSRAVYCSNDTVTIFCQTGKVIQLDLNSGLIHHKSIADFDPIKVKGLDTLRFQSKSFNNPSLYRLPETFHGETFESGLANFLGMKVYPADQKNSDEFKKYTLNLEIVVDKNGIGTLTKITNRDKLPEDRIRTYLNSIRLDTTFIPKETEKWNFDGWVHLMNKSKALAKKEKKRELIKKKEDYNKRIVADTINGVYIPKNLEESFNELNKTLKPKDIQAIRNLKSRDDMIRYHHGLGMWLRNNWGLWGGSRLQKYFLARGVTHPDNMSGLLLPFYYDWLQGNNAGWKEFEAK